MANNCKEIKLLDVVKMKDSGRFGVITEMIFPFRKCYRIKIIYSKAYTSPYTYNTYSTYNAFIMANEDEFEKLYSINDMVRCKKDGKIGRIQYVGGLIAVKFDNGVSRIMDINDIEKVGHSNVCMPKITKVIFNCPATIVMWDDGTKTVVKCSEHDIYDHEKGLAMAICKKIFGDNYYEEMIKKYTKQTNEIEDILPYLTPFQMLQLSKIDKKRR